MKRLFALALAALLILGLAACGQKAPQADLNKVYEGYQSFLPEMMVLDDTYRMNLLGIDSADCTQAITAICGEGMRADEVWLIQAKDSAAMERIAKLANNRIQAKLDETESYVPDQFVIVQQGKIVQQGLYLALLVSPEVQSMVSAFEAAVK